MVKSFKINKKKECSHRNIIKTSFGGYYCPTNLGGCGKDIAKAVIDKQDSKG